jgi:predicted HicB family RNase H-like nuclease
MKQTLAYKGYIGSIEASIEDNCLHGKLLFINDLVTYEGKTLAELKKSFRAAVDGYVEMCKEVRRSPEKPFRGTFNVRVGPETHRRAALAAGRRGVSLNELVTQALQEHLQETPPRESRARHLPRARTPPAQDRLSQ